MSKGIELIAEERQRQIEKEGYDVNHDNQEPLDCFNLAAASYLMHQINPDISQSLWCWDFKYYKPKGILKNLVRAGALVAAAIDKILNNNLSDKDRREYVTRCWLKCVKPIDTVRKGSGCVVGESYWFEYVHDTGDNNENPNAESFYRKLSDNTHYDEVYITDLELIENFERIDM